MHSFKVALSLVLVAASALAQSMTFTYPPAGSTLTAGRNLTMQVGMRGYPENVDVIRIVLAIRPCGNETCVPANSSMGEILYQGPYTPQRDHYSANYTVTVPRNITAGKASLNVMSAFMVGAQHQPAVEYRSEEVTVVT